MSRIGFRTTLNERYFQVWTSEMAYFVGFITADGYLQKRGSSFRLEVASTDLELVHMLSPLIGPLSIKTRKPGKDHWKVLYYFDVSGRDLLVPLFDIGLCLRKSYELGPLQVPDEFFWDFARGYFDGDGWVIWKRGSLEVGFGAAAPEFLKWFHGEVCRRAQIEVSISDREGVFWSFSAYGTSALKILELLYARPGGLHLGRKHQVYSDYLSKGIRIQQMVFTKNCKGCGVQISGARNLAFCSSCRSR